MEREKKVLVEIDYILVPKLKKKKRRALENSNSRVHNKKKVLIVIDRSQLSRDTVVNEVKKHFYRASSKTTVEVVDYRTVERKNNKNLSK